MLNKKGDISVGFVIALVIGVIVLAAAAYFIVKGTSPITNAFDVVPGKLQIFASACEGYAQGSLSISYCEFKSIATIDGKTFYSNCDDPKIKESLQTSGVTLLQCGNGNEAAKNFCATDPRVKDLSAVAKGKIYVNGVTDTCGSLVPSTSTPPTLPDCTYANAPGDISKVTSTATCKAIKDNSKCGTSNVLCSNGQTCNPSGVGTCTTP